MISWLELGALVAVAWCLILALASMANQISMNLAELALIILLLCMFPVWGSAVYLSVEYFKQKHSVGMQINLAKGMTFAEVAELIQFSPASYKVAALFAVVMAFILGVLYGDVSLSSAQDLTRADAVAGFIYASIFYLLALPVVASAARMPGSFDEHFG